MESTQNLLFLMNIQTSEPNILNAWNSLVHMLTLAEIGFASEWALYFEDASWNQFTITITLHGKSDILVKISGWLEKEPLPLSLARKVLLEVLWETFPSYLKESNLLMRQRLLTRLSMEQAVSLEELKPKERETEKQASNSQKEW